MLSGLFHRGRHRGEYQPSEHWRHNGCVNSGAPYCSWPINVKFFGMATDSDYDPTEAVFTITPTEGIGTLPALASLTLEDIERLVAANHKEEPVRRRVWNDDGELVGYAYR